MRRCGIKLTHDGAVAVLEDNRLVFSVEIEKLNNNRRHHRVKQVNYVDQVLADYGYRFSDMDRVLIDGWEGPVSTRVYQGEEVFDVAPYRRGIVDGALLRGQRHLKYDLQYTSYPHYAGHVASSYCTSPYAKSAEDAYVVCWDGAMFPYLYLCHGVRGIEDLGPLHYVLGDAYHELCQLVPPFDGDMPWPKTLSLAGKIMAYVATGRPDTTLTTTLTHLYNESVEAVFQTTNPPDWALTEQSGRAVLNRLSTGLAQRGRVSDPDFIASVHGFMGALLTDSLVAAVERDGRRSGNLCLSGGCALNIKWNSMIREQGGFKSVWVPPFPNDSGSAVGVACCDLLVEGQRADIEWSLYSGPRLRDSPLLEGWGSAPCSLSDLADYMHRFECPVMVLDGQAELGPRALGHRSILAPAVNARTKDHLNAIKDREWYRPVAPMCLEHRVAEIFSPGTCDPYMIFEQDVRAPWRDRIPAACHIDGTARVQTVGPNDDPVTFRLLTAYEAASGGIPVLCNTSANTAGNGFFPDLRSAMEWGRVPSIWSDGRLHQQTAAVGSQLPVNTVSRA